VNFLEAVLQLERGDVGGFGLSVGVDQVEYRIDRGRGRGRWHECQGR
jgi:hypothetical protein